MKKTLIMMLLAAMTVGAAAQEANTAGAVSNTDNVLSENQKNPVFPGGEKEMAKFITKNLRYPQQAEQYGVEGRVVMTFIVGKDGRLKDIAAKDCNIEHFNTTRFGQESKDKQAELKEKFALLFAKEGARLLRKMPKWEPGTLNGEPVNVKLSLPINFVDPNK